ncbi:hypothetical protein ACH5RR_039448 [Cinchona calisaya]|uniref:Uncharacterized protein n=1 Tax=Cinchona calisaya TaxID=153742 RepID=A0ABD2Y2C1_9GENT
MLYRLLVKFYVGIYYDPLEKEKYIFKHPQPKRPKSLKMYEAQVGMSDIKLVINTYDGFMVSCSKACAEEGGSCDSVGVAAKESAKVGIFDATAVAIASNGG